MNAWQKTFREGFAPSLSTFGLMALKIGLWCNDARILQGTTTTPPPLQAVRDWPCEAACPVSYALWQGGTLETVGEVEEAFALACHAADNRLGEPAGVRWFLNWADDTDRETMRRELLQEVGHVLAERLRQEVAA